MDKVYFFDTTLRDGEQSPGASMSPEEKVRYAHQLQALNVDIIEAGFAISSPAQFDAIARIADEVRKPVICSLARAVEKDIESAAKALKSANRFRIHTFIATSPVHREYKLKMSKEEIVKSAVRAVEYAKTFTDDVEFSAEDAMRSEVDYLIEIFEAVIAAGATTINVPDTVGYTVPSEYRKVISTLKAEVPNIDQAVISVHCHNDLGMAVANSLAAVEGGARQVEVAMNGIGERAGNAALEEIAMALNVRKDLFGVECEINTREIYKASKLLTSITGLPVQPNKAIVGKNAFAHEAGIHQDGMIKNRTTYEIMTPEQTGRSSSEIVLGRHSGKHGLQKRLKELGFELSKDDFNRVFEKFTQLADKKKAVYDDELMVLLDQNTGSKLPDMFKLVEVQFMTGNTTVPTATVVIEKEGQNIHEAATGFQEAATGNGPVDAAYKAIERATGVSADLEDYEVNSVSSGKDAMGEVSVTLRFENHNYTGTSAGTDTLTASAQAYLNAINKIVHAQNQK